HTAYTSEGLVCSDLTGSRRDPLRLDVHHEQLRPASHTAHLALQDAPYRTRPDDPPLLDFPAQLIARDDRALRLDHAIDGAGVHLSLHSSAPPSLRVRVESARHRPQ